MSALFAAFKIAGPFLKSSWPYLLCAVVVGYLTHRWDSGSYDRLQAQFAGYKTQVAEEGAVRQKAANDALQAQIKKRLDAEANNAQIIQQLNDVTANRDAIARDRDFAQRLLAAAQATARAGRGAVPTANPQPGTAPAPEPSGDRSLVADLGDAATEARQCFERYNGLLAELHPQLKVSP